MLMSVFVYQYKNLTRDFFSCINVLSAENSESKIESMLKIFAKITIKSTPKFCCAVILSCITKLFYTNV